jgi:tol-pal system protein YbgF
MLSVSPIAAQAQSKDVTNRLNRLENEIQTLNRAVYKGEKPPVGAIVSPADDANLDRLSRLESELRDLTGKVEQQAYDNQQLQIRIDALEQDSRMRLDSLEAQMRNAPASQAQPVPVPPQSGNFPVTVGEDASALPAPTPITPAATASSAPAAVNDGGQFSEDAAALYEQGFGEIKRQEYDAAEKTFTAFTRQFPDHALAPNALYWLGETHYVRKQYDKASRVFAESFQKYPNGPKGADNLLKLGMSLAGAGKKNDACIALKELKRKYPEGPAPVLTKGDQEIAALGCS